MSSLKDIHRGLPPLRHDQRFANNNHLPSAGALRGFVDGVNTAGAIMRKFTLVYVADMLRTGSTYGSQPSNWLRAYIRTGESCVGIAHHLGLIYPTLLTPADQPEVIIFREDMSAVTLSTNEVACPNLTTLIATPEAIADAVVIDADSIASNTEYGFLLRLDGDSMGIAYWAIAEMGVDRLSDSGNVTADPAPYAVGAPIYADDIGEVLTKATTIRKHNSNYLFSWAADRDRGTQPQTISASYGPINVSGATPPNAATVGWSVDLTNRGTLLRGVPIVFAAYAYTSSGSTNGVRLVDQSGNQLVQLTGFGTSGQWKRGTATIDESITRLHVEFKSDGAATFNLFAATCLEYEA